ncbi:MAG TPA: hypothetical protein VM658_22055 [bacterium]|nr:hypothetical protein [bacterium]
MSTDAYLRRLMQTLEKVVAPEIESDQVRGQLYAVVDLINQLSAKIEYKPGIIGQDIKDGREIMKTLLSAMESAGIETPAELSAFFSELESAAPALPLKFKTEEMVCATLDHFHARKDKLGQAGAAALDKKIREYLLKITTRDLGLMKPPMLEKISRSKRPERGKK